MFKSAPATQFLHALISTSGYLHTFKSEGANNPDNSFPIKMLRRIESGKKSFGDGKREYFRFDFPASLKKKGGSFLFFVNSDDKASDWIEAMDRFKSKGRRSD